MITIDERISEAKEWGKGITVREDARGWRVTCLTLAEEVERLRLAFDDQSREMGIACEVMTPEQLTEFRHRAYPTIYPRK